MTLPSPVPDPPSSNCFAAAHADRQERLLMCSTDTPCPESAQELSWLVPDIPSGPSW
ncbi:hypothetical protein BGW80DRAFT_1276586 [Lactifluus volemus]|nr:hypothetical protein BGW80DRAFT_1320814 [Lactifluus volemus]KAH9977768.1 hypothetical protein BGW80DRAFT_1284118 [Lactifluus volemus]KAH9979301.1 hypothetical protein BGW80DRAFT_1276586 [Lactifluus volemus]